MPTHSPDHDQKHAYLKKLCTLPLFCGIGQQLAASPFWQSDSSLSRHGTSISSHCKAAKRALSTPRPNGSQGLAFAFVCESGQKGHCGIECVGTVVLQIGKLNATLDGAVVRVFGFRRVRGKSDSEQVRVL
jgi:hypothetical protein